MKILVTGAGGFLGKGMVIPFEEHGGYELRLMDIVSFESEHEVVVGDVSDPEAVENAVAGMDAIIIAHMAPRGPDNINYQNPVMAFDINVKGTANLLHAAVQQGVKKVVLISSTSAIAINDPSGHHHQLPVKPGHGYYGLSKGCQEVIVEQFTREHGIQAASLRVGYIVDGEKNEDKYGRVITERNYADTDRRDIGEVARLSLELSDLTYETFHVMSTQESLRSWDVQYTCDRLGWTQKYDFSWLATPEKA